MSTVFAAPPFLLPSARGGDHQTERLQVSVTAPSDLVTLCAVAGEVDYYTVDVFRRGLIGSLSAAAPLVVVDLSKVTFFGVAGLRVLIEAQSRLERTDRRLRLVTGPRCVDRLLEVAADVAPFETMTSLVDAVLEAA
ncbi:STAS domain-containing protein [Nocardia sp. NBC_00508]|uniref:STAS domain-containing protein n=1 Tax=Nocardia sp. NBC_00508 TaxID=2975992 RepID=UPI002E80270D|nr:STAS domain-containing protein [Nocardia sp. NBC_00508]WUD68098.1 STAS domain-containing protein [Nocardia sp. NBC_00508]